MLIAERRVFQCSFTILKQQLNRFTSKCKSNTIKALPNICTFTETYLVTIYSYLNERKVS